MPTTSLVVLVEAVIFHGQRRLRHYFAAHGSIRWCGSLTDLAD